MHAFLITANSQSEREVIRHNLLKKFSVYKSDQILIEGETSIETVRDLKKIVLTYPRKGRTLAVILTQIHSFSHPAQTALLKLLEEPPQNTILILETDNQSNVLTTIKSRSLIIKSNQIPQLTPVQETEIITFWKEVFSAKNLGSRLLIASKLTNNLKNREDVKNWLNNQIVFFHKLLLKRLQPVSKTNLLSASEVVSLIHNLIQSNRLITSNVNIKLVLDNLLLDAPSLN